MAEQVPEKIKRTLWRGDYRLWTHEFTNDDDTPMDLTGLTFTAQFRQDRNRGTVTCESVCTVTDAEGGIVEEVLTSEQADLLPGQIDPETPNTVYWDLQSTDEDEQVQTWLFSACKAWGDSTDA